MKLRHQISRVARGIGRRILPPIPQSPAGKAWNDEDGDRTHRLFYDLTPDSVVFDLGGYKGDFVGQIFSMYCCTVHVFEGVQTYIDKITKRYARNPKVIVHPFGLAEADSVQTIHVNEERSSAFVGKGPTETMKLVKAADFINASGVERIDLLKVNIEGGEYELLNHLIDSGVIRKIVNLQVQFHDFVPNAESRMKAIQSRLQATHELTYQFPFVWENWKLKNA